MSGMKQMLSKDLYSQFLNAARHTGSSNAVVSGDDKATGQELLADVNSLAAGLRELGIGYGSRVILALPNGTDYVAAFFAVMQLGAVAVPIDHRLADAEFAAIAKQARPSAAVITPTRVPVANADISDSRDRESCRIIVAGGKSEDGAMCLDELHGVEATCEAADVAARDVAAIFYTTGTGGTPRGTIHSHESLLNCVEALEAMYSAFFAGGWRQTLSQGIPLVRQYGFKLLRARFGRQTWMTPLTLTSIAGHTIMTQAILSGNRLVTEPRFNPRRTLRLIERERASVVAMSPTMAQLLLRLRDIAEYDVSSVLVFGLGGSATPPWLAHLLKERFKCALAIGYGSTELGGGVLATSISDPPQLQAETVGRPFPGSEVRVVDDQGVERAPGVVGELVCRSLGAMAGYLDESMLGTGDGWYRTGDMATMDSDGYVRILGRKTGMIIRGGKNVFPEEIEGVLQAHPDVVAVAAVGLFEDLAGERIGVAVVIRPGANVRPEAFRQYCAERLSPYKVPDRVITVSGLPTAGDGKVKRRELPKLFEQRIAHQ